MHEDYALVQEHGKVCLLHVHCSVYMSAPEAGIAGSVDVLEKKKKTK